jgi:hypothetical protein
MRRLVVILLFATFVFPFISHESHGQTNGQTNKRYFVPKGDGWAVSSIPSFGFIADGLFSTHQECSQWFIANTGQLGGTAGVDTNAVPAWSIMQDNSSGDFSDFKVGWLDSGINTQKFPNINFFVERLYEGDPLRKGDVYGHGTTTLDVFDAMLNHPRISVGSYRIFDERGTGSWTSLFMAFEDAINDGCVVINLSGGGFIDDPRPIESLIVAHPEVTFVFSAGNSGGMIPEFPAVLSVLYDNVISVAAIDRTGSLTKWSSQWATCAAPGETIKVRCNSCYTQPMQLCDNAGVRFLNGTSFSAPMVAAGVTIHRIYGRNNPKQRLIETLTPASFRGLEHNGYFNFGRFLDVQ